MFGLNIYAIYAIVAVTLFCSGFVSGCQHQETKQEKVIREKEHQYQAEADKIRKEKDDQINAINTRLANALVELRNRPSRPKSEATNAATCGTGATLYAEDGEFLIGEAARADQIRSALQAWYDQYDSLEKVAK